MLRNNLKKPADALEISAFSHEDGDYNWYWNRRESGQVIRRIHFFAMVFIERDTGHWWEPVCLPACFQPSGRASQSILVRLLNGRLRVTDSLSCRDTGQSLAQMNHCQSLWWVCLMIYGKFESDKRVAFAVPGSAYGFNDAHFFMQRTYVCRTRTTTKMSSLHATKWLENPSPATFF